jgi:DNA-binding IclR family transcriptional regulator
VEAQVEAGGRAFGRGLEVLESLVEAGGPSTLGELAQRTSLPKPTVHRLLRVLLRRGYAFQDEQQRYQASYRLLVLADRMQQTSAFVRVARPVMKSLQSEVPETIHLAALEGDHAVYVEKLEALRPYRMASAVGSPFDLHCSAMGKTILAFLPPDEAEERIRHMTLRRYTHATITDTEELRAELAATRVRGFALDDEEDEEEVRCVGSAVLDHNMRPIGGICISAPTFQLSRERAIELGPDVLRAAREISIGLGADTAQLPGPYRSAS